LITAALSEPRLRDVDGPLTDRLPTITVVTPSFNQARFLERTIRSVLDQGYPALEYIVMDGGSTDGSADIIARYADRISYWQSQPDGGQTAAINSGWRRATGDILCWLNSDDYYLPGSLHYVAEQMSNRPDVWTMYGSAEVVDEDGRHLAFWGRPFSRRVMILSQNCIPQPSSFVRREAIDAVGDLDETLNYTMDLDLFMRIAKVQAPRYLGRALAVVTKHKDAKTWRDRSKMARERYVVRRRYAQGIERPLVLTQPLASAVYQALPEAAKRLVSLMRPRRSYKSPRIR
jgi:glycosyltransferase involved in cell wall biosynthesis